MLGAAELVIDHTGRAESMQGLRDTLETQSTQVNRRSSLQNMELEGQAGLAKGWHVILTCPRPTHTAVGEQVLSSVWREGSPDLSFLCIVFYLYFSTLSPSFPQGTLKAAQDAAGILVPEYKTRIRRHSR